LLTSSTASPAPAANGITINEAGNVGIGTNGPLGKLHVTGTILARGNAGGLLVAPSSNNVALAFSQPTSTYFGLRLYSGVVYTPGSIGIGTTVPGSDRLDVRGRSYSSGGWHTTNADYAECFESADGKNIPPGTAVSLVDDHKIRPAKKGETPIGIITTNPAVLGNSYKEWPKKYLRDDFGNVKMEKYKEEEMVPKKEKIKKERQKVKRKKVKKEETRIEIVFEKRKYRQKEVTETVTQEVAEPLFKEVDLYDAAGQNVIGKHKIPVMESYTEEVEVLDENGESVLVGSGKFVTKQGPKLNPEYDESKKYIPRDKRPEWACVGLLGQLTMKKGQPVSKGWLKIKDISNQVELWLVK
jgi:hypothetical protein